MPGAVMVRPSFSQIPGDDKRPVQPGQDSSAPCLQTGLTMGGKCRTPAPAMSQIKS
ncbi:hypothetical protein AZA_54939 [Nitrospirillum viridazoti Y2]|nr:hypothetical protein AZA_54939 [Nitrospirillum amazonense Y2]